MNQTFLELLAEIEDFRKGNAIHYRLQDILLVSALAVICNMDTYTEMAMFADHQKKYLAPFCVSLKVSQAISCPNASAPG